MTTFERLLPTEADDVKEIVAGILHAQERTAREQSRPLGRGTHTKGVCVRGTFEVFDLEKTVADPVLRGRLAREVFAKPGIYPATVRFANAASQINPDSKPDVRALSFAVELPPELIGETRRDFSMNNAPSFTINDSHAFAIVLRILEAGSAWDKLMTFVFRCSTMEEIAFLATMGRAAKQGLAKLVPYQRMRFWSGVAFRHGPDEAVKYSLTARGDNPAGALSKSDNALRDDLARQLQTSNRTMEFEFGIQFLDTERMTRFGRKRDAFYWVENAGVVWPEDQAPFHAVGKLTLHHDAPLPDDQANAFYIDVTEHSTPMSHPLGSVNRARWFGESASRNKRLGLAQAVDPKLLPASRIGAPLPAQPVFSLKNIGRVRLSTVMYSFVLGLFVAVILGFGGFFALGYYMARGGGQLPVEQYVSVEYPDRGWGEGLASPDRQAYYYTPQGAGLVNVRYSWFVNLEMPWGQQRLADSAVMSRYGFLVDPVTPRNPDQLPVGFTKHYDAKLNAELLDVTCATCHTGELAITGSDGKRRAFRVDGGQADHAFTDANIGEFLPTLIASMLSTLGNPAKFDRFARKVLTTTYPDGKLQLHSDLRSVAFALTGIGIREKWYHLSPTREGYGRTDALARIGNTVFAQNLDYKNYKVGNAPVSFPAVWNIWKFDWVQYNASVSQPMARNIGESMGVGATYALVDDYGRPLPSDQRFRATALVDSLDKIEQTLRKLEPPKWPTALFDTVDSALAQKGRELFTKNCQTCHGPHLAPGAVKLRNAPLKTDKQPEWIVKTLCAADINTDPNAARNFDTVHVDITKTGLTAADLRAVAGRTNDKYIARQTKYLESEIARLSAFPDSVAALKKQLANLRSDIDKQMALINPAKLPMGQALSYLGTMIRQNAYADGKYSDSAQARLDGFGALDMPQIINGYKARPLAGIWATPPYLHNGSVPTIYALISDIKLRPDTFRVGSREYDPKHLGLARPTENAGKFMLYNTKADGNHNTGHEFGDGYIPYVAGKPDPKQPRAGLIGPKLSEDEKMAILAYLKVRNDDTDGSRIPHVPSVCWDQ